MFTGSRRPGPLSWKKRAPGSNYNWNSRQARVNGQVKNLNLPPRLEKGRLLVPLRFLAENFSWAVEYLPTERAVVLWKPVPPTALFRFTTPPHYGGTGSGVCGRELRSGRAFHGRPYLGNKLR
ncbi:MAG: stalk domain-containing protein [Bacillota bacterium]